MWLEVGHELAHNWSISTLYLDKRGVFGHHWVRLLRRLDQRTTRCLTKLWLKKIVRPVQILPILLKFITVVNKVTFHFMPLLLNLRYFTFDRVSSTQRNLLGKTLLQIRNSRILLYRNILLLKTILFLIERRFSTSKSVTVKWTVVFTYAGLLGWCSLRFESHWRLLVELFVVKNLLVLWWFWVKSALKHINFVINALQHIVKIRLLTHSDLVQIHNTSNIFRQFPITFISPPFRTIF